MINPGQLRQEMIAAGLQPPAGFGVDANWNLFAWDRDGNVHDLPDRAYPIVLAHVAMREKAADDFAPEFTDPNTTAQRRFTILAVVTGMLPRERVRAEDSELTGVSEQGVVT